MFSILPETPGGPYRETGKRYELLWVVAVFLLAFLPRASALAVFPTVDEPDWLNQSVQFLDALSRADWKGTLIFGDQPVHPAVTTRWTGAAGIISYYLPALSLGPAAGLEVSGMPLLRAYRPSMELLACARRFTALLAALVVVVAYLLLRRLVSHLAALLAVTLLALDPFYIGLTRVVQPDGLNAIFALLSVLCLAMALTLGRRRWFVAAGVAAGLAFLSKSPSVVLLPLAVTVTLASGAVRPPKERCWSQLAIGLVIWLAAMVLTVFVVWPAMWVDPVGAIAAVLHTASVYANTPHESGNFFWGLTRADPGVFFYPVAILFRSSPLVLIGAAASLVFLPGWLRNARRAETGWLNVALALWGLAAAYLLMFTLGAKKFDRYILTVILALDVLAGLGWAEMLGAVGRRWSIQPRRLWAVGLTTVLVVQSILCLSYYPYYLTYYNPALGGGSTAVNVMPVGWGEGLDQIVKYLNSTPGRAGARLGTVYPSLLDYLGEGRYTNLAFPPESWTGQPPYPWAQLDYALTYVDARQRGMLPPRAFNEFFAATGPEYVVRLGGIEYASLYRIPREPFLKLPPQTTPIQVQYPDEVKLAGFRFHPTESTADGRQLLPVTLYWQVRDPCIARARLALKLLNGVSTVWASSLEPAPWGYGHCGAIRNAWGKDVVFPDERVLEIYPGTPPGSYQLEVILVNEEDFTERRPTGGESVLLGPVEIGSQPGLRPESLDMDQSVDAMVGDRIRLLGFKSTGGTRAGQKLEFTAFWQCLGPVDESYKVFLHLVDKQGRLLAQQDGEPVTGFYPTNHWKAGEIVRDQYSISFPDNQAASAAGVRIGMYRPATGERLPVTLSSGKAPEDRAVAWP